MTFYSVSIPAPVGRLQQLAQISTLCSGVICAFWRRKEKQVLFETAEGEWIIQPNGNIRRSLAVLLECSEQNILADNLVVFEGTNSSPADDAMERGFLQCDWSDFASDIMAIQVDINSQILRTPPLRPMSENTLDGVLRTPPRILRRRFYD